MTLTIPSRRRFLLGAGALLAAPSIVRVASLMPASVPKLIVHPPVLGITFGNLSSGFLIPTASEIYTFRVIAENTVHVSLHIP